MLYVFSSYFKLMHPEPSPRAAAALQALAIFILSLLIAAIIYSLACRIDIQNI